MGQKHIRFATKVASESKAPSSEGALGPAVPLAPATFGLWFAIDGRCHTSNEDRRHGVTLDICNSRRKLLQHDDVVITLPLDTYTELIMKNVTR